GFATRYGDRAIEHPGLMGIVLGYAAGRGLLFLDLTASPRSLTAQTALATGAESLSSAVGDAGDLQRLREELDRRAASALRMGEGIWVLRHAPGLPAEFARAARAQAASGDPAPRWVTLRNLRLGTD